MKRSTRNLTGNSPPAWADLARQFGEMWLASAQVVAHRTARMAAAGPVPLTSDCREFALMGREKIEAATESAFAIASHLTTMKPTIGAPALGDMASGSALLAAFCELAESAARIAGSGLQPIHARAIANARRLGKR